MLQLHKVADSLPSSPGYNDVWTNVFKGKLKIYLSVSNTVFLELCCIIPFAKTHAMVDSYPRTDPITEPAKQPRSPKCARSNPQVKAEKEHFLTIITIIIVYYINRQHTKYSQIYKDKMNTNTQ